MRALAMVALLALAAGKPVKVPVREPAKEAVKEPAKDTATDAPRAAQAPSGVPLLPRPSRTHVAQTTACAACHSTTSWSVTKFAHEKTGFPLEGQHQSTGCKACHPVDFSREVPSTCSGCHVDVHVGELGARCEGCHDPASWKSRFPADAHRLTAFPLVGRHAALPCGECHFTEAAGRFSRAASGCAECHQKDYDRTALSSVDHAALGFPLSCENCHNPWTFKRARFPQHDVCFTLSSGSHAAFSCLECHSALPAGVRVGTCTTNTTTCTSCHEHECGRTDPIHVERSVLGYRCQDNFCAGCHKNRPGSP